MTDKITDAFTKEESFEDKEGEKIRRTQGENVTIVPVETPKLGL